MGDHVRIGPVVVINCGRFSIDNKVVIFPFNLFKNLVNVKIGEGALIGQLNQFTAAPAYQQFSDRVGTLIVAQQAAFTNRH
jgi:hypothetical protein